MNKDQKIITSVLIIGAVAVFLYGGWWMGSHMWGTGIMFGWGGMGMGGFWLLFLIGLYLLFSDRYQNREDDRANSILRERYARGDLSEEEYMEMKKKL